MSFYVRDLDQPPLSFEEAAALRESEVGKAFTRMIAATAEEFGLSIASVTEAVGIWEETDASLSLEPSFIIDMHGDERAVLAAAAVLGRFSEGFYGRPQQAVLCFFPSRSGPDLEFRLEGVLERGIVAPAAGRYGLSGGCFAGNAFLFTDLGGKNSATLWLFASELGLTASLASRGTVRLLESEEYGQPIAYYRRPTGGEAREEDEGARAQASGPPRGVRPSPIPRTGGEKLPQDRELAATGEGPSAGRVGEKNRVTRSTPVLSYLRSVLILNNLIYLYTIVLGACSFVVSLFDSSGRMQHRLARLWSWLILKTTGVPVAVTGLDRVDVTQPHLYACNHLSAMDIPLIYVHLPFQFRIIAKRELFRYPFLGWHLRRSGQIAIERDNAHASMRSLRKAVEGLRHGMPLFVFPEGGRSGSGEVQPFLPGAFYVAIKAGVEVVPCAIVGTYEMLPMNTFHLRPRPLELVFGEPIPTTGYTIRDMDKLAARVQAAVEELYYARAARRGGPAWR